MFTKSKSYFKIQSLWKHNPELNEGALSSFNTKFHHAYKVTCLIITLFQPKCLFLSVYIRRRRNYNVLKHIRYTLRDVAFYIASSSLNTVRTKHDTQISMLAYRVQTGFCFYYVTEGMSPDDLIGRLSVISTAVTASFTEILCCRSGMVWVICCYKV